MRQRAFILSLLIFTICFSIFVLAEEPPNFDNHQFYGEVSWNKTQAAPKEVKVQSSLGNFTSGIKSPPCLDTICTGEYGYKDTGENILRVKGTEGETITFYLDKKAVSTYIYKNGESTKVNLDLGSTVIIPAEDLKKNESKKDEAKVSDSKTSSSSSSSSTKTSDSGVVSTTTAATCTQNWECGLWGTCQNSLQTRKCFRVDICDKLFTEKKVSAVLSSPKPAESQPCVSGTPVKQEEKKSTTKTATCSDGIKNQNEVGVDCGGVCKVCPVPKKTDFTIYYLIAGIVLVLGAIGGLVYYFVIRPKSSVLDESTIEELRAVYGLQERRGMTEDEITEKMVERGWDENILKKFLKKR